MSSLQKRKFEEKTLIFVRAFLLKSVFGKLLGDGSNHVSGSMHCRRNDICSLLEAIHWPEVSNHQTQSQTYDEFNHFVSPFVWALWNSYRTKDNTNWTFGKGVSSKNVGNVCLVIFRVSVKGLEEIFWKYFQQHFSRNINTWYDILRLQNNKFNKQ